MNPKLAYELADTCPYDGLQTVLPKPPAYKIALAVLSDLCDRSGVKQELEAVDDITRREMVTELIEIIDYGINEFGTRKSIATKFGDQLFTPKQAVDLFATEAHHIAEYWSRNDNRHQLTPSEMCHATALGVMHLIENGAPHNGIPPMLLTPTMAGITDKQITNYGGFDRWDYNNPLVSERLLEGSNTFTGRESINEYGLVGAYSKTYDTFKPRFAASAKDLLD